MTVFDTWFTHTKQVCKASDAFPGPNSPLQFGYALIQDTVFKRDINDDNHVGIDIHSMMCNTSAAAGFNQTRSQSQKWETDSKFD